MWPYLTAIGVVLWVWWRLAKAVERLADHEMERT